MAETQTVQFCESAAKRAKLDPPLEQGNRFYDTFLVLCFMHVDSHKEAGSGDYEFAVHDAAKYGATVVREALRAFPNWRCVLLPTFNCMESGGILVALYDVNGKPIGGLLRWASEEHYNYASSCLLDGPEYYEYAYQLSLDSCSWLSKNPDAVRVLALTGSCGREMPDGSWGEICHPKGERKTLEHRELKPAVWRAAVARYNQHPHSKAVLLVTGRAKLTALSIWCGYQTDLNVLMAVRTLFREGDTPAREMELFKIFEASTHQLV